MSGLRPATIDLLQQESFSYFLHETNRRNGLVRDKTRRGWPASIAAVGMALTAYPVGVERGFMTRADAVRRVLATLRFFWKAHVYGIEQVSAGPLFVHQLSHLWIDFRGIRDAFMRERGIDYFENSRRATLTQQQYAIRNPRGFRDYNARCWGPYVVEGLRRAGFTGGWL